MKLGIVLRKYRVITELSLRQLAKEIGVGPVTLMRIEMGHDPSYTTFKRILDWLST